MRTVPHGLRLHMQLALPLHPEFPREWLTLLLCEAHTQREVGGDAGCPIGNTAAGFREIKEFAMNLDIVEGNWKQIKGKVKAQWGRLTDDQLDVIAGKRIELAGKIQEVYGITKDEAEEQIKKFEQLSKDNHPKRFS